MHVSPFAASTTYVVATPSVANVTVAFPPATATAVPDVVASTLRSTSVATLAVSAAFGVIVKVYVSPSVSPVTLHPTVPVAAATLFP